MGETLTEAQRAQERRDIGLVLCWTIGFLIFVVAVVVLVMAPAFGRWGDIAIADLRELQAAAAAAVVGVLLMTRGTR